MRPHDLHIVANRVDLAGRRASLGAVRAGVGAAIHKVNAECLHGRRVPTFLRSGCRRHAAPRLRPRVGERRADSVTAACSAACRTALM